MSILLDNLHLMSILYRDTHSAEAKGVPFLGTPSRLAKWVSLLWGFGCPFWMKNGVIFEQ